MNTYTIESEQQLKDFCENYTKLGWEYLDDLVSSITDNEYKKLFIKFLLNETKLQFDSWHNKMLEQYVLQGGYRNELEKLILS